MDGQMGGWMGGYKAGLRIAYSNQKKSGAGGMGGWMVKSF